MEFVRARRPETFLEPFCGGSAVGLTLLHRGLVGHLVMAELDTRVGAFWRRALSDESFADEVESFNCALDNVQEVVEDESEANYPLWVLVKGRCGFGGVLDNSGLKKKDLTEKWCATKVVGPALRRVYALRGRITLTEGNGLRVLQDYSNAPDCVAFSDPPYSAEANGGPARHLYRHHELNHEELFRVMSEWTSPWLMTHSDCAEVRTLIQRHGLQAKQVRMTGNNGQRVELAISRDLSALPGSRRNRAQKFLC